MKKLILTTIFALALPVEALAAEQKEASNTGFFLGAQVGYNYLKTKMDSASNFTDAEGGNIIPNTESDPLYVRLHSFIGGMSIGYLWALNESFFAGVDLESNFDTIAARKKITQSAQNFEYKMRRHFSMTPSFIIGRKISPMFRVFLKLGLVMSYFEYKLRNNTDNLELKENKFDIGLAPSVGLDYMLNQNWSIATTATYEMYKKNKTIFQGTIAPAVHSDSNILQIKPDNFSLKLSLRYFF